MTMLPIPHAENKFNSTLLSVSIISLEVIQI